MSRDAILIALVAVLVIVSAGTFTGTETEHKGSLPPVSGQLLPAAAVVIVDVSALFPVSGLFTVTVPVTVTTPPTGISPVHVTTAPASVSVPTGTPPDVAV